MFKYLGAVSLKHHRPLVQMKSMDGSMLLLLRFAGLGLGRSCFPSDQGILDRSMEKAGPDPSGLKVWTRENLEELSLLAILPHQEFPKPQIFVAIGLIRSFLGREVLAKWVLPWYSQSPRYRSLAHNKPSQRELLGLYTKVFLHSYSSLCSLQHRRVWQIRNLYVWQLLQS